MHFFLIYLFLFLMIQLQCFLIGFLNKPSSYYPPSFFLEIHFNRQDNHLLRAGQSSSHGQSSFLLGNLHRKGLWKLPHPKLAQLGKASMKDSFYEGKLRLYFLWLYRVDSHGVPLPKIKVCDSMRLYFSRRMVLVRELSILQ